MSEDKQERAIVTINEQSFYADSLTPEANAMIQNINIIDGEIQKAQLSVDIAKLAKDSTIEKLEALTDNFEKVPAPEKEDEKAS